MEAVGAGWKGWAFGPKMGNGAHWVSVTMMSPRGSSWVESKVEEELKKAGWRVAFRANWWSSGSYGVAMFEAERDGQRKTLVVKWSLSSREEVVKVEEKSEEEGREEFYSLVDMVSDDFMHDSVLRSMMSRY